MLAYPLMMYCMALQTNESVLFFYEILTNYGN